MPEAPNLESVRQPAIEVTAELKGILPASIDWKEISTTAVIPFKAQALHGSMLYRLHDLADTACFLLDAGRTIPGMITARAALETTAVLHVLVKKVLSALDHKDVRDVDEFLVRALAGSHYFENSELPYRVGTAMGHLEKDHDFMYSLYEWLSEHTHPNRLGGIDAYSHFDDSRRAARFGFNGGRVMQHEAFIAVSSSVVLAIMHKKRLDSVLPQFIALCEKEVSRFDA